MYISDSGGVDAEFKMIDVGVVVGELLLFASEEVEKCNWRVFITFRSYALRGKRGTLMMIVIYINAQHRDSEQLAVSR